MVAMATESVPTSRESNSFWVRYLLQVYLANMTRAFSQFFKEKFMYLD